MKVFYKMLSKPIDFDIKCVNTLVLESPSLYRCAVMSLLDGENDTNNDFILSDLDKSLPIRRVCEVITDPFCLDSMIDKKIVTFLHKELSQVATHELVSETAEIFATIHRYLSSVLELSEKELCFEDRTDPADLLHAFHVRPDMKGMGFCEKILSYMELLREYMQKRLFVFCGLHLCLHEQEMKAFLQDVTYRKLSVLLLEPCDCKAYVNMGKTIIDHDFCEI